MNPNPSQFQTPVYDQEFPVPSAQIISDEQRIEKLEKMYGKEFFDLW